jgi:hypothetical protein
MQGRRQSGKLFVIRLSLRSRRPHRHERPALISLVSRQDVDVDVWDFLACKRAVVDTNGEIGRGKMSPENTLHFCDTIH